MKLVTKTILTICLLLIVSSCKKNSKEYEILNDFIQTNKIEITCLQDEPFCFKDLHLTDLEKKTLNINLKNDVFCNGKIDLDKLHGIKIKKEMYKSQISFPIYSNDGKYIYVVVSRYYTNKINFYESTILYKLEKINNHWKIIDEYKNVTQS
ncbi:hypothetical protein LF887_01405 [Chryseobacterium sp. MEBOG06]|uniref:hypothetical protein n=1 Tax=Chryseobacterium sp. MEBOG06 TaxID=2879938 RepID=UPI001F298298|nr:hypothetical protein [Chryseobacterium sp. MEBOG06]UKB84339.1 hypothetical protein LF887_01405 [Chryseobacterium sp. MEBOG06]